MAENSERRFFQWVVGPRKGEVLVFDKIVSEDGVIYICFKDNSRINEQLVAQINSKDLTNKMMAEVDSPTNVWQFKEEIIGDDNRIEIDANSGVRYEVPTADEIARADLTGPEGVAKPVPKKKKVTLIPPRPTPPSHSVFGQINSVSTTPPLPAAPSPQLLPTPVIQEPIKFKNESDPVYILMSKAKKLDSDISMQMTVALPPRNLYNIAKDSFEEGGEKFIDYIIEEITVDEIKNALKVAIAEMYEESPES